MWFFTKYVVINQKDLFYDHRKVCLFAAFSIIFSSILVVIALSSLMVCFCLVCTFLIRKEVRSHQIWRSRRLVKFAPFLSLSSIFFGHKKVYQGSLLNSLQFCSLTPRRSSKLYCQKIKRHFLACCFCVIKSSQIVNCKSYWIFSYRHQRWRTLFSIFVGFAVIY